MIHCNVRDQSKTSSAWLAESYTFPFITAPENLAHSEYPDELEELRKVPAPDTERELRMR